MYTFNFSFLFHRLLRYLLMHGSWRITGAHAEYTRGFFFPLLLCLVFQYTTNFHNIFLYAQSQIQAGEFFSFLCRAFFVIEMGWRWRLPRITWLATYHPGFLSSYTWMEGAYIDANLTPYFFLQNQVHETVSRSYIMIGRHYVGKDNRQERDISSYGLALSPTKGGSKRTA